MDILKTIADRAAEKLNQKLARVFLDTTRRMGFVADGVSLFAWKLIGDTIKTECPINVDAEATARFGRTLIEEDTRIVRVPLDPKALLPLVRALNENEYVTLDIHPATGGFIVSLSQTDRQAVLMSLLCDRVSTSLEWYTPFTAPAGEKAEVNKQTTQES